MTKNRIGLIINPYAGIGGKLGWKGSDHPELFPIATEKEVSLRIPQQKIEQTLKIVSDRLGDSVHYLTCKGLMGGDACISLGVSHEIIYNPKNKTTSKDTKNAIKKLNKSDIDLLIFAGGDGTARDILDCISEDIICIGIPSGVKMHSSVYAINPILASHTIINYLEGKIGIKFAEVMDIDENLLKEDIMHTELYGYLSIPDDNVNIQHTKSGGQLKEIEKSQQISEYIIENINEDSYYIIAPGSTTAEILKSLNLDYTLLGIDVIKNNEIIIKDANEEDLKRIVKSKKNVYIIISVIGGQGFIFGRGNQQISENILRKVPKENIIIISTPQKIIDLKGRPLLIDTGNIELNIKLSGYYKILVGYDEHYVYKVE